MLYCGDRTSAIRSIRLGSEILTDKNIVSIKSQLSRLIKASAMVMDTVCRTQNMSDIHRYRVVMLLIL